MNCEQFAGQWNSHVARLLEPPDESHMLDHSRACDACGTKWREHDELTVLLASVIQPLKPPENSTARIVERLPPAPLHRPVNDRRNEALPPTVGQALPLLLAAFLGGMAMHVMSGAGGRSSLMEQLAYQEMIGGGRMGRGGFSALAFGASDFVGLLMALVFLFWITRAGFWEVLFPLRMPRSVLLARWLAIPTLMLGALRLLLALWILVMTWTNAMFQGRSADPSVLIGTSQLLDQLWTLGFWFTLLVLLFAALNEVTVRHARPLQ